MQNIRTAGRTPRALFVASTLTVALTACGLAGQSAEPRGDEDRQSVTVHNCGAEVTIDSDPERLVLLKSASVPALSSLGVLDRAVARAGAFPEHYFDAGTNDQLAQIPELTSNLDGTGHLHISRDVVIAQEPDLVFGEVENLPRHALAELGIPVLEEPLFCSTQPDRSPDFRSIYDQLRVYGAVFGETEEAEAVIAGLEERVAAVRATVDSDRERSGAVLYPTVGGGTTYAYGAASMPQAQLAAAGIANVFGDQDQRVLEVTPEQLLGYDPDVVVLLHSEGSPDAVEQSFRDLPGADELTAVRNDAVMTQLLNFSEPATPLAVDGLEQIVERFHR